MLERISEPTSYQAFQHFITHAPWEAEVVWRRLRAVTPERTGILILDETSFPKSGPHSVGVARQYCGALGKVANCQVAVTAALWTGQRAWPMGAALYLPEAWTTDPRAPRRGADSDGRPLSGEMAARPDAAPADARGRDHADRRRRRRRVRRQQHRPANAASPAAAVCAGHLADPDGVSRHARRCASIAGNRRRAIAAAAGPIRTPSASARSAMRCPPRGWRRVTWRNGTNPPWEADFAALRVTPATDWRHRRLAPEVWLLCERGPRPDGAPPTLLGLAARVGLADAARAAGASALGDRTALPGSQNRTGARPFRRPVVSGLAAPHGDQRGRLCVYPDANGCGPRQGPPLTFPQARAFVQEIFTGLLFISRPRYMQWMKQAEQRFRQLRI